MLSKRSETEGIPGEAIEIIYFVGGTFTSPNSFRLTMANASRGTFC
jgi:hypothetical protein